MTVNVVVPKPGGRHALREPLWRQVGWLLFGWLAFGAQTNGKARTGVAGGVGPNEGARALASAMDAISRSMRTSWNSALSPPPPQGWRRVLWVVRSWLAAWLDHEVAVMRLMVVREWCKTIMMVALCGTFLYVCWALVEWVPT